MKNTTDSSTDKGRSNKKSKLTKEKSWLRKVFHLTGSTGKKKKAVDSDEIMKTVEVSVDDVIKKGAAGETATEVADGGEEKKATSASQRDGFWEPDNPDSHVVIRDSSERFSGETPFGEDGDKKKKHPPCLLRTIRSRLLGSTTTMINSRRKICSSLGPMVLI
mmetsp:Transcript_16344/g.36776  ORF Transcript_16344/g.36776 Transcript_16344/m.36776 type:complete len:163 (+) Transcript_16344:151-639(+)